MKFEDLKTIDQLIDFLSGPHAVAFSVISDKQACYRWNQGDLDERKGGYHINAVDEVTQFEVVCTVERISEQFLIPALEQMLDALVDDLQGFKDGRSGKIVLYGSVQPEAVINYYQFTLTLRYPINLSSWQQHSG